MLFDCEHCLSSHGGEVTLALFLFHTSTFMAFISQHCSTPEQLPGLLVTNILDISLNFDWDNLNDDVTDFLLAAAEHTNAPPVGLHDSDTTLR